MDSSAFEMKQVVLRDLESVLKIEDQMIVENYTTKSLLPPGENYGSTIFSVHVELKNKITEKKEDLHVIAKMCPPTEYQKELFNSSRTFIKEIFMYETIMPAYNKLELECGLRKNEVFELLPKFYGARLSLQPDGEFDEDAVLLMENLKIKGYYSADRATGYDLDHAGEAVKAMARFHSLGIAMKQKRPGIFEMFKMYAKPLQHVQNTSKEMFGLILEQIKKDPEISPHFDKCNKILSELKLEELWADSYREPWISIIHCDFWVNNVMFHCNDKGKIDNVKFVDFQIYLYGSPVRDLLFFLYSSVKLEVTEDEIDALIDLYYETVIDTLNKMGCDTSKFNREGYKEKLAEDAVREFSHISFMIKMLTLDTKEIDNFDVNKMQDVLVRHTGNELFNKRLRKLVLCFVQRNWI